jgi:GDP-L-fucose synthase
MKVLIFGAEGMVGSALMRRIPQAIGIGRRDADLRDQSQVIALMRKHKPNHVYIAAAKVGGIIANSIYPGEFLYDNLMIQSNIIHASKIYGVDKLMFLGSSCIYPRNCKQPMKEEYLFSGVLESTNKAYAVAKLTGIELCKSYNKQYGTNYISVIPTNLYGQGDNYDLNNSHVIPALIRKIWEAKSMGEDFVEIWGTGNPKREFMHVDDLADACCYIMKHYDDNEPINVGSGEECTIAELAMKISKIINYKGSFIFDSNKPDGVERKLMDSSKLKKLGWSSTIALDKGLKQTIDIRYGSKKSKLER